MEATVRHRIDPKLCLRIEPIKLPFPDMSVPQPGGVGEVDRLAAAVHGEHYAKPEGDLGGGHGYYKDREHLAGKNAGNGVLEGPGRKVTSHCDKGQIDPVEHQLDGHQNGNDVAPGQRAVKPNAKEHRGDYEHRFQGQG